MKVLTVLSEVVLLFYKHHKHVNFSMLAKLGMCTVMSIDILFNVGVHIHLENLFMWTNTLRVVINFNSCAQQHSYAYESVTMFIITYIQVLQPQGKTYLAVVSGCCPTGEICIADFVRVEHKIVWKFCYNVLKLCLIA